MATHLIRFILLVVLISFQLLSATTGNIKVYFSPEDHCDKQLINLINMAKQEINIAIYSLTKDDIAQAIVSANNRGVIIKVIVDYQQASGRNSKDEYLLSKKIQLIRDKHSGFMHNKFAVIDRKTVITGSYNWTNNATKINDENMVVVESPELAKAFNEEFEELWKENK